MFILYAARILVLAASSVVAFPRRSGGIQQNHHAPAPDVTSEFPYANSKGGLPGTNFGGWVVPAEGDEAHQWQAPQAGDITVNNLARYGFIARDGRTTFAELVSGAVNMWNMGYDQAVFLTTVEFSRNGDLESQRITIGAPDYTWSNSAGFGAHGAIEQDTSISREDKGISGDASTLSLEAYKFSSDICNRTSNDRTTFTKDIEWVPEDWWTRDAPYTLPLISVQIAKIYSAAPVPFGANAGRVNSFDIITGPGFTNGIPDDQSPEGLFCLLGNTILANDFGASGTGGVLGPPLDPVRRAWTAAKLGPIFQEAFPGCVLLNL
ncbi:hypothetical protein RQP46_006302 [Phenoliferia psychrophenolica]